VYAADTSQPDSRRRGAAARLLRKVWLSSNLLGNA
jgi:hypothetical protein